MNYNQFTQLDQYICWVIQQNGIVYVVDNYLMLRDEFYRQLST